MAHLDFRVLTDQSNSVFGVLLVSVPEDFWNPILQNELNKFLPVYETLLTEQANIKSKLMELDYNMKLSHIPSIARMKPRLLGQFSKYLSLE
jgi:hypothetical protein